MYYETANRKIKLQNGNVSYEPIGPSLLEKYEEESRNTLPAKIDRINLPQKEIKNLELDKTLPFDSSDVREPAEVVGPPAPKLDLKNMLSNITGDQVMQATGAIVDGIQNNESGNDWANTALDAAAPALMAAGPYGMAAYGVGKITTSIIGKNEEDRKQREVMKKAEVKNLERTRKLQLAKFAR